MNKNGFNLYLQVTVILNSKDVIAKRNVKKNRGKQRDTFKRKNDILNAIGQ